jgi:hypothetical protein
LIIVIIPSNRQDVSNMYVLTFLINRNFIVMKIIIVRKISEDVVPLGPFALNDQIAFRKTARLHRVVNR